MSQIIAVIVSIAVGAILLAASLFLLDDIFTEQSIKAEANKLLNEVDQINNALTAYVAFNTGLKVGFSDPNNDGDYSDSEIFRALEEEEYLKNSKVLVNEGGYFLNKTNLSFSKILPDQEICMKVNEIRNRHPAEGLSVGVSVAGYGVIAAEDLVDKLPKCGTNLGNMSVCCVSE